jgi:hypothetical protein
MDRGPAYVSEQATMSGSSLEQRAHWTRESRAPGELVLRPDLVLVFLWYSICRNLLSLVVHSGPFLTLSRCHAFLSEMLNQKKR